MVFLLLAIGIILMGGVLALAFGRWSNLAGWLAQEKDFSTIPSRGPVFRPLRRSSALVRAAVKLVGFFFLPAGTALWGLIRWRRRRARRPLIQKEWEAAARA